MAKRTIQHAGLINLPQVVDFVENLVRCLLYAALPRQACSSQHLVQNPSAMPGLCGVKDEFTAKLRANGSGHACDLSAVLTPCPRS